MAGKQPIIMGIEQRVQSTQTPNYRAWRIGITHDVPHRYEEWGKPSYFLYWEADSLQDAQTIEAHFIHQKGMDGGTGGDLNVRKIAYVYIF